MDNVIVYLKKILVCVILKYDVYRTLTTIGIYVIKHLIKLLLILNYL